MHLVFLNQYYPPDAAPTGVVLRDVAEALVSRGHLVTIICSSGGYAEERHKTSKRKTQDEDSSSLIHVRRIRATRFGRGTFLGKGVDYGSYYFGVVWRLMFLDPRPDRIVALTTPPYLSVLARLISRFRGADHAHWVMDLYPDVMVAHGLMSDGGCFHRGLVALARWGFGGNRCAGVLTLGPDMAERVDRLRRAEQGSAALEPPTLWVPLWGTGGSESRKLEDDEGLVDLPHAVSPTLPSMTLRRQRGWADDELVVMYSGNMGLGHRFGEILEVMGREVGGQRSEVGGQMSEDGGQGAEVANGAVVCDRRGECGEEDHQHPHSIRWVFFGGGKRRGEIEAFLRKHPGAAVELHDYAPAESLVEHLQSADLHLVSLDSEWTGTMVPSKLQGIFDVGRPVIFIGSGLSSIGRWVLDSGGGWVVRPGDATGLLAAIDEARDSKLRNTRGQAAGAYANLHFRRDVNASRVAELFGSRIIENCPKV